MNGLNSMNDTFRFLSNHACMNRGSTIGKNINYILWKYEVPPNSPKDVSWDICRY